MSMQQPPEKQDAPESTVVGAESSQAIQEKAEMLVGISARLGIPLGNDGSPELQAAVERAQVEHLQRI